ncbi:hypothetical protein FHT86_000960 [Rhizobium sp. BK313]|uniref:hypothetical protein n=1 Tax=Rhizobium sp. BK313 TaxID=2587081 RepID=UPI00141521AE|nr:hypothetical protein [Rhizobium sp. BK313]MBB3452704.1 hypothetical protein [Rhizobium sp. BK313]
MPKPSAQIQESPSLWSDNELRSEIRSYPDQGPRKIAEKYLHIALGEMEYVFRSMQRILLARYIGAGSFAIAFKNGTIFTVGPPVFDTCKGCMASAPIIPAVENRSANSAYYTWRTKTAAGRGVASGGSAWRWLVNPRDCQPIAQHRASQFVPSIRAFFVF